MKKVLYRLIQFSGFFLLFCLVLIVLVSYTTPFTPYFEKMLLVNPYEMGENYERAKELDVWLESNNDTAENGNGIMLGASTIFSNINPYILGEQTGIDFFCAASNGQPPISSLQLLKYCISTDKKIDFLFMGVDHILWDFGSNECTSEWVVNNYKPGRKYVFDMVRTTDDYTVWVYFAYFSIKRLLPGTKDEFTPKEGNDVYMGKGFTCCDDTRPSKKIMPEVAHKTMSEENHRALTEIIKICRENNIEIRLFIPGFLNYKPDIVFIETFGAPYIDATPAVLDSTYYYDNWHLYCSGTTAYSYNVAALLKESLAK